ncbi:MAG: adenylate/guanylate cyclase domain-containing protein [Rhizobiaceae bacterium]|nr:adenylate/guanylate cyclase domain-containing protein [Rhizobiaceae bacterium]
MAQWNLGVMFSSLLRKKRTIIWLSGLVGMLAVLALAQSPLSPFQRLQVQVFDTYQRLAPRPYGGAPVLIVDIDEESLGRVGQWPWPRSTLAAMTDRLGELGAAAIVFDIVFAEADRTSPAQMLQHLDLAAFLQEKGIDLDKLDNDLLFAEAIGRNPSVTGILLSPTVSGTTPPAKAGISFGGENPTTYLPESGGALANLPILDAAASGIGLLNFRPQFDGIVRRVPVLSKSGDILMPALSIEALRVAQGASGLLVRGTGASGEADSGAAAMTAMKVGHFEIPTDADGALWVYYTDGRATATMSAHELVGDNSDPVLEDRIAGQIVLIGTSAQGLRDLRATPMSASVAGVTIHAEIIDQIMSGVSLVRPDWARGLELAAAVLLSLLVIVAIPFLPVAANVAWAAILVGLTVLTCWWVFIEHQMLLDPVLTSAAVLVAMAAASAVRLLVTEHEERFVRDAFGHYLAPTLVDQLARNPEALVLGGESRQLTLLFCDIRSFTKISEGLSPTELTELLNNFLTPMTDVLLNEGATIDKYMGDAIMAFWNAPLHQDDHAIRGCNALLKMQAELAKLNANSKQEIKIGVGLNSGECCVGNLGSTQRFNYSAIGDAVNVAARIESLTKQYGLTNLVSETTGNSAPDVKKLEVDRVQVVGRKEPLVIMTLLSHDDLAGVSYDALVAAQNSFLAAYYTAHIEQAREALQSVAKIAPACISGLYEVYAKRLTQMEIEGVPDDWDGVFVAKEK